jgi:carbonic anhydrase
VTLNAAQSAYDLRQEVERSGKWEIDVYYTVYNTRNHRVSMPFDPSGIEAPENVHLALAPTNPRDFTNLAVAIATSLLPRVGANGPVASETAAAPIALEPVAEIPARE